MRLGRSGEAAERHRRHGSSVRSRTTVTVLLGVLVALIWTVAAGGSQPYDTYETAVATDGPVAQYRFDDAAESAILTDSAGSYTASNSGILLGGEGPFGGSKSGAFDGEAYSSLSANPLASASAFTAEAWVDWSGGVTYSQPIFDFSSEEASYMYLTPASGLTEHKMLFEIRSGSTNFQVTSPMLTAKVWEYVAVTETSTGVLTLYLNGEQVGQTTGATLTPSTLGSTPYNFLGKSPVSGGPVYDGSLSNVAFYDKALTIAQIQAHYDAAEFPVNSSLPEVSGTAKEGDTLTASTGSWTGSTPITFAYQWTRCNSSGGECANIASATSATYLATQEDVGSTLRVVVTATNSSGNSDVSSKQTSMVAALAPFNTTPPAISGTAEDGQPLTTSNGIWSGTHPLSYTYQWESCDSEGNKCQDIENAAGSSYTPSSADLETKLRVQVTATNIAGFAQTTSVASSLVKSGPPGEQEQPSIAGTPDAGDILNADPGLWTGTEVEVSYQWESCNKAGGECSNIQGATSSEYTLSADEIGTTLRVRVGAANDSGSLTSVSLATKEIGESYSII